MTESLLPQRFLFRFSAPCLYRDPLWKAAGARLDEKHRLVHLAELDDRPAMAEVSAAWSEAGLVFAVSVGGKKQPVWCRASPRRTATACRSGSTRATYTTCIVAGRFCHRFLFLPSGGGRTLDEAFGQSLPIDRAREPARPVAAGLLQARSQLRAGGYKLECFVPAEAMLGYRAGGASPSRFYVCRDRSRVGRANLQRGRPMPYDEDPGLWATLDLVRGSAPGVPPLGGIPAKAGNSSRRSTRPPSSMSISTPSGIPLSAFRPNGHVGCDVLQCSSAA